MEFITKYRKYIFIIIGIFLFLIVSCLILFNFVFIKESKVKDIIYKETKLDKNNIQFNEIKLNYLKGQYKVDFSYNSIVFNYYISAWNGKVIKNNFDDYPDKEYKSPYVYDYISKEEALNLVINDLATTADKVKLIKSTLKKDDTSAIYIITIDYQDIRYQYQVDGIGGKVLNGYTKIIKKK